MASEENLSHYKETLEKDSKEHRKAFEEELAVMLDQGKKVALTALVVGGSFALSFYVIRKLAGGKKKKTVVSSVRPEKVVIKNKSSLFSSIKHVVFTEAAVLLMAVAKQKLQAYLKHEKKLENENPENA